MPVPVCLMGKNHWFIFRETIKPSIDNSWHRLCQLATRTDLASKMMQDMKEDAEGWYFMIFQWIPSGDLHQSYGLSLGKMFIFFSFRFIDIYWMNKNAYFLNFRSTWWFFWILIGCLQVTRRVREIDVIEFSEFTSCSISKKHGPNGPNMFSWIWKGLSPVWEKNIKKTKFWSCTFRGDFAHNLDKHSVFFKIGSLRLARFRNPIENWRNNPLGFPKSQRPGPWKNDRRCHESKGTQVCQGLEGLEGRGSGFWVVFFDSKIFVVGHKLW